MEGGRKEEGEGEVNAPIKRCEMDGRKSSGESDVTKGSSVSVRKTFDYRAAGREDEFLKRSAPVERHTPDEVDVGVEGRELEIGTVTEGNIFDPPA